MNMKENKLTICCYFLPECLSSHSMFMLYINIISFYLDKYTFICDIIYLKTLTIEFFFLERVMNIFF